ncbi:hypothetical protein [Oceanisphaera pacifica]|uniref:DUF4123 domain-containing protein n=1 Tax=Oceanisphaera pacifica TaxID=2818389 RepID=A0ABS3NDH7_9GAMM|nr:hypothetical protein [Oceanisphaera pacifica]MBO1518654.1 hypothetical protein [Oceanisphaera pacifica]
MTDAHHWQLILAQDYDCPSPPTLTWFQQLWRKILRIFGQDGAEKIENTANEELAGHQSFDRTAAVGAMTDYLADWVLDAKSEVAFLLDPPFSGTAAIARDWTWQQGWALVTPPSMAQIRDVDLDGWWQQQNLHHSAWLIDDLARFLLRSSDGLRFIRVLLPRLLQGDFGQGLVVCDSWTFAFLRRTWPLTLPRVYCFPPASAELLRSLGAKGGNRQLGRVVGEARGNVGVALSLWSCKVNQEQQPPTLPSQADDKTGFILYALLVHRGLTGERIQDVLSTMAADELNVQLLRLAQFGIVESDGEYWRLSVRGYLISREFLAERDYLLDDF